MGTFRNESGAGNGFHIRKGDFQRNASCIKPVSFRSIFHSEGQEKQHIIQKGIVRHILLKGHFFTDALSVLRTVGNHLPMVNAVGKLQEHFPLISQKTKHFLLFFLQIFHGINPKGIEFFCSFCSYREKCPNISVP